MKESLQEIFRFFAWWQSTTSKHIDGTQKTHTQLEHLWNTKRERERITGTEKNKTTRKTHTTNMCM